VHYGAANKIMQHRHDTLTKAYLQNPTRFSKQPPKLKHLPEAVYINPPQTIEINSGQQKATLAG
jgi:hypothetical protein